MPFTQQTYSAFPINYFELPVIVANTMPGSSLSNKIQAANDALGSSPGEIWIFEGGNINTNIILSPNRTVRFFDGNYYFSNMSKFYYQYNTSFFGQSWNTILYENEVPRDAAGGTVQDYFMFVSLAASTPTGPVESPYSTTGALRSVVTRNIEIMGLKFQGLRRNLTDATTSLIGLWNAHNAHIHRNYFNEISGYVVQIGAEAGNATTAITEGFEYAWNFNFHDNRVENFASQALAAANSDTVFVHHNKFINPGKKPISIASISNANPAVITLTEPHDAFFNREVHLRLVQKASDNSQFAEYNVPGQLFGVGTMLSPTSFTLKKGGVDFNNTGLPAVKANTGFCFINSNATSIIDFESNATNPRERNNNYFVQDNIFDCRQATYSVFSAITMNNPTGIEAIGGIVSGNIIKGVESTNKYGNATGYLVDGIAIAAHAPAIVGNSAQQVQVFDNRINNIVGAGLILMGDSMNAHHNTTIEAGRDGRPVAIFEDLTNSKISDNTFRNPNGTNLEIHLRGYVKDCDFDNNIIGSINPNAVNGSWLRHSDNNGVIAVVTDCSFNNNKFRSAGNSGGVLENTSAARNTYDGNTTNKGFNLSAAPNNYTGTDNMSLKGTSKIITHKHWDGTVKMPGPVIT